MLSTYENFAKKEMLEWQKKMCQKPALLSKVSKKVQNKINSWIPEKLHHAITITIKQLTRGILFGSEKINTHPIQNLDLMSRELLVHNKMDGFKKTAATEGAITGAGGILLGLADFPILIAIKIKLLYEIAAIYGIDTSDYKERIYLLHIFELAFSSPAHRKSVFLKMENWNIKKDILPTDIHHFDWRKFQQEYRDYLDIAKMAQLLPVIGAPVGLIVNYRLIQKLGITAMNAYRMRFFEQTN